MKKETVCFVAGRSGGHLLPALTLARNHKQVHPHDTIYFFTTNTELDNSIIQKADVIDQVIRLSLDNVPTRWYYYPRYIINMVQAIKKSISFLRTHQPTKIVSLGGYISIPLCLAARLLKIPIDMYELNVIPGRANLFLARYARIIYICFGASATYFKRACNLVPYPIRFPFELRAESSTDALQKLNFSPHKKTICVVGGSQGSLFINDCIKKWLNEYTDLHHLVQIIHQTGGADTTDWAQFYKNLGIPAVVFNFSDTIELYYQAADFIICRAGAGTLFEIQFFNKRCITIPLKTTTTEHQIENARAMQQQFPYLFTVLDQEEIIKKPTLFADAIADTLKALHHQEHTFFVQRSL